MPLGLQQVQPCSPKSRHSPSPPISKRSTRTPRKTRHADPLSQSGPLPGRKVRTPRYMRATGDLHVDSSTTMKPFLDRMFEMADSVHGRLEGEYAPKYSRIFRERIPKAEFQHVDRTARVIYRGTNERVIQLDNQYGEEIQGLQWDFSRRAEIRSDLFLRTGKPIPFVRPKQFAAVNERGRLDLDVMTARVINDVEAVVGSTGTSTIDESYMQHYTGEPLPPVQQTFNSFCQKALKRASRKSRGELLQQMLSQTVSNEAESRKNKMRGHTSQPEPTRIATNMTPGPGASAPNAPAANTSRNEPSIPRAFAVDRKPLFVQALSVQEFAQKIYDLKREKEDQERERVFGANPQTAHLVAQKKSGKFSLDPLLMEQRRQELKKEMLESRMWEEKDVKAFEIHRQRKELHSLFSGIATHLERALQKAKEGPDAQLKTSATLVAVKENERDKMQSAASWQHDHEAEEDHSHEDDKHLDGLKFIHKDPVLEGLAASQQRDKKGAAPEEIAAANQRLANAARKKRRNRRQSRKTDSDSGSSGSSSSMSDVSMNSEKMSKVMNNMVVVDLDSLDSSNSESDTFSSHSSSTSPTPRSNALSNDKHVKPRRKLRSKSLNADQTLISPLLVVHTLEHRFENEGHLFKAKKFKRSKVAFNPSLEPILEDETELKSEYSSLEPEIQCVERRFSQCEDTMGGVHVFAAGACTNCGKLARHCTSAPCPVRGNGLSHAPKPGEEWDSSECVHCGVSLMGIINSAVSPLKLNPVELKHDHFQHLHSHDAPAPLKSSMAKFGSMFCSGASDRHGKPRGANWNSHKFVYVFMTTEKPPDPSRPQTPSKPVSPSQTNDAHYSQFDCETGDAESECKCVVKFSVYEDLLTSSSESCSIRVKFDVLASGDVVADFKVEKEEHCVKEARVSVDIAVEETRAQNLVDQPVPASPEIPKDSERAADIFDLYGPTPTPPETPVLEEESDDEDVSLGHFAEVVTFDPETESAVTYYLPWWLTCPKSSDDAAGWDDLVPHVFPAHEDGRPDDTCMYCSITEREMKRDLIIERVERLTEARGSIEDLEHPDAVEHAGLDLVKVRMCVLCKHTQSSAAGRPHTVSAGKIRFEKNAFAKGIPR